ncbi:MAG: ribosomal L7Ae/L30e/S12e/Gadd45 family protein [Firmicutes bacterium]|nr:ribosomal L7Ae/L30e/S12e/Gadd45 family protein [Bacillota bacterium]
MKDKIYSFLGLATKAGKLISGEEGCEKAVKKRKAHLVIIAEDASNNMKMRFINMCRHRGVDIRIFGERDLLGKFTGKDMRVVIAILQEEFAKKLVEMIDNQKTGIGGV